MNLYQRINGADWCNIFVVGDLHGCYTLLMNELDKVSFDPARDLLISVGDLVDRGAENVECLDLITMPWFRAVRGNHEQMMLDALVNGGSFGHWMSNGGGWWHQLDSEQDVQLKYLLPKITNLPMIIELVTGNKKIVICHADYPHNEYAFDKPVPEEMVIWNRERVSDAQDGIVSEITGADLFIFGHTPAHHPLVYANQMYIDTGAVFCGNLTLTKVQEG
ncbi:serine/threonine protein phosphatase [Escherichia coli]|uniref:serine/threonine protein phosphatase n=1 Tax=Escherichia coli TaxID=562 RepID=UPI0017B58CDC|nr:serine/threonine protein phosphatase [Escherichia coli]EFB6684609.1 serine/threonine protein phosphatase [Escherichia coli]ELH6213736.1 serine/threonine protein phosphatase [Escherichia coli]MDQ8066561.1 serine/threonine protein phosphatase [Escherichia coli]HAN2038126.1 serine/threonine protein phosphatase [Escherichia coli]